MRKGPKRYGAGRLGYLCHDDNYIKQQLSIRYIEKPCVDNLCLTPCKIWTGSQTYQGYGKIHVGRISLNKTLVEQAHRAAYRIFKNNGVEPTLHVLHLCRTPLCINIDHLYEGTDQDNADDAREHGTRFKKYGINRLT